MVDDQSSGLDPAETPENEQDEAGQLTRRQVLGAGAAAAAGLAAGEGSLGSFLAPFANSAPASSVPLEERLELAVAKLSTDHTMINKLLPKSTAKPAVLQKLQLSDVKSRYEPAVVNQLMKMMKDAATAPGGTQPATGERTVEWVGALATLAAGALAA